MSRLAFPAGARPHIPNDHIAGSPACSFVTQTGADRGIDLTAGAARGTLVGTPTVALDGAIGPSVIGVDNGTAGYNFSGKAAVVNVPWTIACVVRMPAAYGTNANAMVGFGASADTGGFYIRLAATTGVILATAPAGTTRTSTIAPDLNAPYFIAVSNGPTEAVCNYFIRRLDTGAIKTTTTANSISVVGNGVVAVSQSSGRGFHGRIHCGMISLKYTAMNELLSWSDDPWSFWYDRA